MYFKKLIKSMKSYLIVAPLIIFLAAMEFSIVVSAAATGRDYSWMSFTGSSEVTLILTLVILLLAIILLSYIRWKKIKPLFREVNLADDGQKKKLVLAMYLEVLVWVLIAAVPAVILSLILNSFFPVVELPILICALLVLWGVIPFFSFYKIIGIESRTLKN